jgi:hypothetical protein
MVNAQQIEISTEVEFNQELDTYYKHIYKKVDGITTEETTYTKSINEADDQYILHTIKFFNGSLITEELYNYNGIKIRELIHDNLSNYQSTYYRHNSGTIIYCNYFHPNTRYHGTKYYDENEILTREEIYIKNHPDDIHKVIKYNNMIPDYPRYYKWNDELEIEERMHDIPVDTDQWILPNHDFVFDHQEA